MLLILDYQAKLCRYR